MTNWFIWELAKPVVAQVQGYSLAGGTELATVCDFRIVADDAKIGYPPVRAMTTMDMMWAAWCLPPAKAREFAYMGDSISGTEIQALSAQRNAASEWGRRVREDGLKAALEWRDGPFRDFRGAYASAPHERPVAGTQQAPEMQKDARD